MRDRLCLAVCDSLQPEVQAALDTEAWDDVVCIGFPARCGRPPLSAADLLATVPPDCTEVLAVGGACLAGWAETPPQPALRSVPIRAIRVEPCMALIAPPALVQEAIAAGSYLMTPAWLADWPARVRALGWQPETASTCFAESFSEMLLLDTGLRPDAAAQLQPLGAALGLPVRRLAIGLDGLRQILGRWVLQWRLTRAQAAATQRLDQERAQARAEQFAVLDLLGQVSRAADESAAITVIAELMQMLFAPRTLHWVRVDAGVHTPAGPLPEALRASLAGLEEPYALTPDGEGFWLRIGRADAPVAKAAVLGLTHPEHRERYLSLALALANACALAIENARIRQRLLQTEKLASLSIVVAGVAHEINTPLAVDLISTSALRRQVLALQERFESQRMTRGDLTDFLQQAAEQTQLIHSNLQRIGALVETFQQAAVGGPPPEAERVLLRDCVLDVQRMLSTSLQHAGVDLRLVCDPDLSLYSHAAAWASVFSNLIGNSIKHGFQPGEPQPGQRHLDIRIEGDASTVRVDYRDNGRGMRPEVLARVFDPFFTTEMQSGMGLGMHLVFNLVTQRFGGSIACDSQVGAGVSFRIEVPR